MKRHLYVFACCGVSTRESPYRYSATYLLEYDDCQNRLEVTLRRCAKNIWREDPEIDAKQP